MEGFWAVPSPKMRQPAAAEKGHRCMVFSWELQQLLAHTPWQDAEEVVTELRPYNDGTLQLTPVLWPCAACCTAK